MRSAFRSFGVPSIRELGTASLIGGPSNRPMRAGFAENSFLVLPSAGTSALLLIVSKTNHWLDKGNCSANRRNVRIAPNCLRAAKYQFLK